MKILIVEDDKKIAAFVAKGFKESGFTVDAATNGEDGLHLALSESYDACIIDLMLPKMDGLTLIERMRQNGIQTPVLILSARHTVDDRVKGLQAGGDDYLIKPFAFSELLARAQALIRRSGKGAQVTSTTLTVADLSLDIQTRKVFRGGKPIDLQPREFSLLAYLMRHAGQVISKTVLLERIWDYNFDPQTNVVDVLVSRLRSKIDKGFEKPLITTVRGVGYAIQTDHPKP